MKYRVTSQRWDIDEHTIAEFQEDSDEKAKEKFDVNFKKAPGHSWNNLKLLRFTEVIIEISDADKRPKAR